MKRLALLALSAVLSSGPVLAQELGASWLRGKGLPNALNPRISAIPDFVAQSGPRGSDGGMRLREFELGLQTEVDPYARVDAAIGFPGAGAFGGHAEVKVEEAYATLTQLPFGVAARAGKFLANFGRLNIVHTHELDQVDRPLALAGFLGDHGLASVGGELSASRAVGPALVEAGYALLNDVGAEAAERKVEVNAPNGDTVEVKVDDEPSARRRARDLAHVARLRAAGDAGDWTADAGLSGALHQPRQAEHRKLGGLDLTLKWKPQGEGLYKSFLWRSELLHSRRDIRVSTNLNGANGNRVPGYRTERRGFYSYGQCQWARRWQGGLRLDYAESATNGPTRQPTRALSPYVTWRPSEFNRLRLQWQYRTLASRAHEHLAFLQWTLVLGPHGAHPF